ITYLIFKKYEPNSFLPLLCLLGFVPGLMMHLLRFEDATILWRITTIHVPYLGLILFYIVIYRLSPIHPLANYPGPVINKISKFVASWTFFQGKAHLRYQSLHQEYGDIVRVGPNEISINSAEAIIPILTTLAKGQFWDGHQVKKGSPTSLLAMRDIIEHRKRRKTWNNAFGTAALRSYQDAISNVLEIMLSGLDQKLNQTLDFNLWLMYYNFDAMGQVTYGNHFNLMQGNTTQQVRNAARQTLRLSTVAAQTPWAYRLMTFWKPGSLNSMWNFREFAISTTLQRLQNGSNSKDLFYYLADEGGLKAEKPAKPVIISDSVLAMVAGSDTTAGTLTILWYFLLKNPISHRRLLDEIDQRLSPAGDNFVGSLARMPYLDACMNEALRLYPPAMSGSPRYVDKQGATIGPWQVCSFIPPGTQIFLHTYSIHRDPSNFSEPKLFWPDRWLALEDRIYLQGMDEKAPFIHKPSSFIPFSLGPASCPGKELALMSVRALTCSILLRYTVSVADGFSLDTWEEKLRDHFTIGRAPLPVVLKLRKN
ncbi:cytochrome P450, partial [Mycena floridula]